MAWFTRETNKTSRQEVCTTYVKKHGSHEYVVFERKGQDENTSGESMIGNSHCMNCDGKQGPPSTEKIENAGHSLSLTSGSPDMGNDLGSVNQGLLSGLGI